ncbi:hypothetical protein SELMODRAFT_440129 [Selaginella moellendorffii]|uniref:Uncharacterized protein n=1 Tax=Selaginella moellendorffii TaxID=88036 RepID=D8RA93_SELML|nr:hypothetical protein SELMODRAFT_440129 [Selaginella moellendorffii]
MAEMEELVEFIDDIDGAESHEFYLCDETGITKTAETDITEADITHPCDAYISLKRPAVAQYESRYKASNIQVFMERFIDVSQLDMPAVISTYTGRRRLLSTAIEKYIMETAPAADWFMEFARRMITQTGRELGVHRSLRDDAVLLWNNLRWQVL